mmetsp:Transcript_6436/g.16771  ORF Transcript_6436/g.16771 Transcript_6436/m.16771 type:complete len:342 (-) Transcript_6436:657-1682(-)
MSSVPAFATARGTAGAAAAFLALALPFLARSADLGASSSSSSSSSPAAVARAARFSLREALASSSLSSSLSLSSSSAAPANCAVSRVSAALRSSRSSCCSGVSPLAASARSNSRTRSRSFGAKLTRARASSTRALLLRTVPTRCLSCLWKRITFAERAARCNSATTGAAISGKAIVQLLSESHSVRCSSMRPTIPSWKAREDTTPRATLSVTAQSTGLPAAMAEGFLPSSALSSTSSRSAVTGMCSSSVRATSLSILTHWKRSGTKRVAGSRRASASAVCTSGKASRRSCERSSRPCMQMTAAQARRQFTTCQLYTSECAFCAAAFFALIAARTCTASWRR